MSKDCLFCNISSDKISEDYDKKIISTNNFFVIAGKGQIVNGYILIVPVKHCLNLKSLDYSLLLELDYLKKVIRDILLFTYNIEPVFFEHGAISCNKGGSCIEHAHIHALPLKCYEEPNILKSKFEGIPIDSDLFSNIKNFSGDFSYFYFELSNAKSFIYKGMDYLPSQFGRQVISVEINKQNWNWREQTDHSDMLQTYNYIASSIKVYIEKNKCKYEYGLFFNCLGC